MIGIGKVTGKRQYYTPPDQGLQLAQCLVNEGFSNIYIPSDSQYSYSKTTEIATVKHVFNFGDTGVDQYTYGEPLCPAELLTPNHSTKGAHPPGSENRSLSP